MVKNKNNQTIWKTRIKKKSSALFEKIGSSIEIDKNLYKQDIEGSIVHVEMLFRQKIISFKIKNKIMAMNKNTVLAWATTIMIIVGLLFWIF